MNNFMCVYLNHSCSY